jgi:hypothetical protein
MYHKIITDEEKLAILRGRIVNQTSIPLPESWRKIVDASSITVCLTPIGAHQDIIVKRIGDNQVFLQSQGGIPIYCYYHIYGVIIKNEEEDLDSTD